MWEYNYNNGRSRVMTEDELAHYGVLGMKWGVRRARKKQEEYYRRAKDASDSAKEWDEAAKYAKSKGKTKRAARFEKYAEEDRADASKYSKQAKESTYSYKSRATKKYEKQAAEAKKYGYENAKELERKAKRSAELDKKMERNVKNMSTGKTAAKMVLAGPFATKTYEVAKAAGYGQTGSAATAVVSTYLGGPFGNMAANAIIRNEYVNRKD